MAQEWISIKNARQNNLKNISLKIPQHQFIVVTGVSGSGKSSLAFEIINKEGQTQFFINLSAQARKYLDKLQKPKVDSISGLTPTISIAQKTNQNNPRSTVGTLTGIYDYLRLLFARLGEHSSVELNRSLFSFNSNKGACEHCRGLGVEDKISVDLLIDDKHKTIREGCFKITNPDGYIIYSQVRMEELAKVCEANGFSVDIPWEDLSLEQQDIILNGSDKIKILYGKHSLESRMKWTGIKANPREKEFYKGILPVMNQILNKDRNPNILRFAKTQTCSACQGSRLRAEALEVTILNQSIYELSRLSLSDLKAFLQIDQFPKQQQNIAQEILSKIHRQIDQLTLLGLDYLSLERNASSLSAGEIQSIRLASQLNSGLNNITYIFDEPSVGLHASKNHNVIRILKQLVAQGNTVIVVEHDAETIRNADWIVEIGPKAGTKGGELLFNGSAESFFKSNYQSLTKDYLTQKKNISFHNRNSQSLFFEIRNACINNLKNIDVRIKKQALNIITGVSGAGKSSLVHQTLIPLIQNRYHQQINATGQPSLYEFDFEKTLIVEQAPIGKTARSTPATYTKLFDLIRNFYAQLPQSKQNNIGKSYFSFNNKGGRCEHCEGAGKIEIGMHFLGNVESPCPVCNGLRFKTEILNIKYHNKSISDVLNMTVEEAIIFFEKEQKIQKYLQALSDIGLGYIQLGQSSNTLSGGEAQRIRLASELVKNTKHNQLFIFDEPSTGLHFADIQILLNVFQKLTQKGHTILLIEHNEDIIKNADYIIDLGPHAGAKGGKLVFEGTYSNLIQNVESITARSLFQEQSIASGTFKKNNNAFIELKGVTTHNLKSINIKIPHRKHTVIVGKSGSGKSSLAFDTLYAEAQNRFAESFPTYVQQFTRQQSQSQLESATGLRASIALKQNRKIQDPRSTVGTLMGINDYLRLLLSRFGTAYCPYCQQETHDNFCKNCKTSFTDTHIASHFSFNHAGGTCPKCKGLGEVLTSNLDLLVENLELSFLNGAFKKSKLLDSYANINEKYMATLLEVGRQKGFDYHLSIENLPQEAIEIALYGVPNEPFNVEWTYKTKTSEGVHKFEGEWIGFVGLLLDEYYRRQANGKGSELMPFLTTKECSTCNGQRFKAEILNVRFHDKNIYELSNLSIEKLLSFFQSCKKDSQTEQIIGLIIEQLNILRDFNLSYLHLDRKSSTLSGGELQRLLLSAQLKGSLTGMCYILDEPSSGLHPSDIQIISKNIKRLIDKGNTVISVEHQNDFIRTADYILELGPEAGKQGGEVVFSGPLDTFLKQGQYISSFENINFPEANNNSQIRIQGARIHNLHNIDVSFLKNTLNVITGVSGSGKTTLMRDVLIKSHRKATHCQSVSGLSDFDALVWIDRNSMEQSSFSSLATYLGILDDIKKLFSPLLKGSGIKTAQLSYNNKSGQCPDCKGLGFIKTKMDFLNDVRSKCETCKGNGYKNEVLRILLKGKNIAEILQMTVAEALLFFSTDKVLKHKLELLDTLGLSYLNLKQESKSFSGGEAQRIKIAKELLSNNKGQKLYIFDEASRGLHHSDLKYLLQMFSKLISEGHSIIAIEHNIDIINKAKYIIDLHDGKIVYKGELKGIRNNPNSLIAKYIRL